jgi:hypothetical protein
MDKTRDALANYHRKRDFKQSPEPAKAGREVG